MGVDYQGGVYQMQAVAQTASTGRGDRGAGQGYWFSGAGQAGRLSVGLLPAATACAVAPVPGIVQGEGAAGVSGHRALGGGRKFV